MGGGNEKQESSSQSAKALSEGEIPILVEGGGVEIALAGRVEETVERLVEGTAAVGTGKTGTTDRFFCKLRNILI
jgi:hypothetical protein